jgi:predicted dehydrogenase
VKTLVGFNYMKNPTAQLAKEIIARGEIGEVIHFYGTHNEDYMADPLSPFTGTVLKRRQGWGRWAIWRRILSTWRTIWSVILSRSAAT